MHAIFIFSWVIGFFFSIPHKWNSEYVNEDLVLHYANHWVLRPVDGTTKRNLLLETEKFSAWSPLMPDEDRKTLRLTMPSSMYYGKKVSLRRLERELKKQVKSQKESAEWMSNEDGLKDGVPFIRVVFSYKTGRAYEVVECYLFAVHNRPYALYMTASRKEYHTQRDRWDEVWESLQFKK
ncbi:hypothetical protein [Roseivirga sp. UBA838]|uniref:hypothetical protein n=1 Tax=Roseivirga sp. UBA838 TaxID=1947393 RepID=UPI00257A37F6|nr:hypothetical protein [Roseivirga sp. UBA838]|tara:strand:+ start:45464 stop:46003 length:540 start_codon:yes stop_codon:yes gene_type:complete